MLVMEILLVIAVVLLCGLVAARAFLWAPERPVETLRARWARPPSRFVELDGMKVHLRDEGQHDDPTPMMLLHGTGASLHTWEEWVRRLGSERRMISLDRPGFGLTGPNPAGDYTTAHYAAFLGRLLDTLGIERCVLAGPRHDGRGGNRGLYF